MKNTLQHINEWKSLIKHIGKFDSFIEIGTHKGGTFSALADLCSGKKISIDYCDGNFGGIGEHAANVRNTGLLAKYKDCHFIEGDSTKFETVKKLFDLLNGQKVDFLFIDGNHTFEGVQHDYAIYRQFVRQGGYIAFHDIVDSEFHRNVNCNVATLWKKLEGEKVSFISPDNSDCTEDAKPLSGVIWGGIGVIKNEPENVNIFQIFYDENSLKECLQQIQNYVPTLVLNVDTTFYENAIIKQVYENYNFKEKQYIGITSPRIIEKTGYTVDNLVSFCTGQNVINYWNRDYFKDSFLELNKRINSSIHQSLNELNSKKVINFDLIENGWQLCYCNFWLAKTPIFERYCNEVLLPAMKWLSTSKWIQKTKETGFFYRNKYYPASVFVCEGLFGLFLAKYKK